MTKKKSIRNCKLLKTLSKNYWTTSTIVLAVLLVITLATTLTGSTTGAVVSPETAGQKIIDFAKSQGIEAEFINAKEDGFLYEVTVSINGQEAPIYITKDGKTLVPQPISLEQEQTPQVQTPEPTPTNIPKSDNPTIELFVMTHCPYGTQAEKGFIPLLESFTKADAKIRFVHYFMHQPEETETPRQICIREEQPEKFLPYLRKFLEEGNSEDAIKAANIDEQKMNNCIESGKWEEYYNKDKTLSESYGVRGSPTLVINGQIVSSGRDSASYLTATCEAFNNAPEECSTLKLSNQAPSPMWGWDASGSNTQAQC